ncbi:MAG: SPFH domain-containing protein [Solobacterium sp.]|nr:SPFH domain-containing protein [Solobacterium sp.]
MGLIQAALSAAGSTFADQWKEYFYCDAIPSDTIAVKARKKTRGFSSNHGDDNIISDGSVIAVADGQCMIIVEQGQVVDICAQPGEFKYDSKTEPSLFTGSLSDGLQNVFAQIGKRFAFGGQPAEDQRVYYFNTKELPGQKYGTPNPVPFRVVDQRAGIDMDISLKCFGEYSLKVTDPITFYTNVSGNFANVYKVDQIAGQLKSELLTAMAPAFARIGEQGIRYSSLMLHTGVLADALNDELSEKWGKKRGIEIASFGISSLKADEEDEKRLKEMQQYAAYTNPALAGATMVGANAQAMKDAAKNANGAAMGFVGLNAAQAAGGINVGDLYAQGAAAASAAAANNQTPAAGSWTCPTCGQTNNGKFCGNCGTAKPVSNEWFCTECGTKNSGKFCSNCGTKKPE